MQLCWHACSSLSLSSSTLTEHFQPALYLYCVCVRTCVWQGNNDRKHCLLVRVSKKWGKGWFLKVCRQWFPSISPPVIWATSGGANKSSLQAVFAYDFRVMICSTMPGELRVGEWVSPIAGVSGVYGASRLTMVVCEWSVPYSLR